MTADDLPWDPLPRDGPYPVSAASGCVWLWHHLDHDGGLIAIVQHHPSTVRHILDDAIAAVYRQRHPDAERYCDRIRVGDPRI